MSSKSFSEINSDFTLPKIIYLDNATRTFKPNTVNNSLSNFNTAEDYEVVRDKVRDLIRARKSNEIIFTSGATHSINLVAQGLCKNWHPKDCVIVPESEHHANLLVWKTLANLYGFRFETVNVIKDGSLDLGHLEDLLSSCEGRILYSTSHISNTIGYIQPIKEIFNKIKEYDGLVLLDASLSLVREEINVQDLDIDFLVFSANKIYGPSGVGVLYGKHKYLEKLSPIMWGGNVEESVLLPQKLEPSNPNFDGVIGLGSAIDWFRSYDIVDFQTRDKLMNANFQMMLNDLDFVEVFHPGYYKGGLISFSVKNAYPKDVFEFLKTKGIVLGSGYLNARPIVEEKFTNGVLRISWACYNSKQDVEVLKNALMEFNNDHNN